MRLLRYNFFSSKFRVASTTSTRTSRRERNMFCKVCWPHSKWSGNMFVYSPVSLKWIVINFLLFYCGGGGGSGLSEPSSYRDIDKTERVLPLLQFLSSTSNQAE
jgi:hypothetical protein